MNKRIGIIGGSGLYDILRMSSEFDPKRTDLGAELSDSTDNDRDDLSGLDTLTTPYGDANYAKCTLNETELVFISRHGWGDSKIPPHRVPYKANIWAMKELGVEMIISTSAVGTLRREWPPGYFVIPDQFIDLTKKVHTFFDGGDGKIVHIDLTEPFCPVLIDALYTTGIELGLSIQKGGVYGCSSGPQFETPAEIKMLRILGIDVVGMTVVPECKLARELELCYATISLPVNWAAGMLDEKIEHKNTLKEVEKMKPSLLALLKSVVSTVPHERKCDCGKAVEVF